MALKDTAKKIASTALSKTAHIDWSKFFTQAVVGVFLVAFVAQVFGGYVVNRIEENRQNRQKKPKA